MTIPAFPIRRALWPALVLAFIAVLLLGCGSSDNQQSPGPGGSIRIETVTPIVIGTGGKPSTSPIPATPAGVTATPGAPTATPGAQVSAPTTGKWIDVDVTRYQVRLMDGTQALQTISPVAVGAQVNSGAYESTQTGLFRVYNKIAGLQYDAPYKAYISDWVAFDRERDNGFHSFLLDESGKVVDGATGRVSNGCIRTGAAKVIFDFAEVGMPVYVHL